MRYPVAWQPTRALPSPACGYLEVSRPTLGIVMALMLGWQCTLASSSAGR